MALDLGSRSSSVRRRDSGGVACAFTEYGRQRRSLRIRVFTGRRVLQHMRYVDPVAERRVLGAAPAWEGSSAVSRREGGSFCGLIWDLRAGQL